MTRRKPRRKPRREPAPLAPQATGDADPLADVRIRPLLERYCDLAGVEMLDKGADLRELKLPPAERAHFRDRDSLRLALSLDALARHPEAEIAALGSPFLSHVIEAIRARAGRLSLGLIPPPPAEGSEGVAPAPAVPVKDGTVRRTKASLAAHPIGRLLARVVLRAGAAVEEAVIESDVFDLSTGARLSDDIAGLFQDLEAQRVAPADPDAIPDAALESPRKPEELLQLLVGNLRDKSAERVHARQAAAEREITAELDRLDRYFASVLADKSDPEEVRTITALHERRRTEEVRRHQVKAIVHPQQLVEARLLVQRVEWELTSARGRRARLAAQRPLAGTGSWTVACPHCGHSPEALVVCRHEHGACDACSSRCSVCAEDFCRDHGIARCRVDEQPACEEHARVCQSCRMEHCSAHEGVCAEGGADHPACTACLEACGSCGRIVCNRHAEQSRPDAPKGSRRLCAACVRYCEGGTSEPVGVDEVTECATCGKSVCTAHQAVCVVDGQVHCSRHLRPTDGSRRLVCARHRAACAQEPAAIFASDEVGACPVCGKDACDRHRARCGHCGRHVCLADLAQQAPPVPPRPPRHCSTCAQLVAIADPPDEVVTAALAATGRAPRSGGVRAWRTARDRTHLVVELDLGWRRRTVFTLRHGDTVPEGVVTHSLVGSKRRR